MTMLNIPPSLEEEHKEIMESLHSFSSFGGKTGTAVKELLEVLEPHFEKEEEVAMPVLGSLSMLVSRENYSDLNEIAASEKRLEHEYKKMFE